MNRNIIKITGLAFLAYILMKYGVGTYDTYRDASVRAYTPLIVIEGTFYLILISVVLFILMKSAPKPEDQTSTENPPPDPAPNEPPAPAEAPKQSDESKPQ